MSDQYKEFDKFVNEMSKKLAECTFEIHQKAIEFHDKICELTDASQRQACLNEFLKNFNYALHSKATKVVLERKIKKERSN